MNRRASQCRAPQLGAMGVQVTAISVYVKRGRQPVTSMEPAGNRASRRVLVKTGHEPVKPQYPEMPFMHDIRAPDLQTDHGLAGGSA